MYEYVKQSDAIELRDACERIIKDVQKELKDYFTFQFKLIGSGEKRLITKNGEDGVFDLDYNLILQKDKKDLINKPDKIKNLFINAFNKTNPKLNFLPAQNRTSVIKSRLKLGDDIEFSFDIAIMCEGNNGNLFKIVYDNDGERYIWNEIKHTEEFEYKFSTLKSDGYWTNIKALYLKKKNMHLSNGDNIASFSVLIETVNELWRKYYD